MGWKEWVPTLGVVAVVAVAIVWTNRGGGAPDPDVVAPRPGGEAVARVLPGPEDRTPRCLGLTGTPDQRVVACLADLGRSTLSDGVSAVLADAAKQGKIATAARGAFPGEQVSVIEDADLRGSALGTDEQAFAKALRDRGVRAVVVSRDFTQALDRDRVVLARLAHHDFVEWFQLRWVTEDLLVYTVRSSPARIPIDTGDDLLRGLRQRLTSLSTGRREVSPQRWNPKAIRLIGSMRTNGATLSARHVVVTEGANVVERALDELAGKLIPRVGARGRGQGRRGSLRGAAGRRPARGAGGDGAGAGRAARPRYALFELFEMGVDGDAVPAARGHQGSRR
jgi:hypothetical protein